MVIFFFMFLFILCSLPIFAIGFMGLELFYTVKPISAYSGFFYLCLLNNKVGYLLKIKMFFMATLASILHFLITSNHFILSLDILSLFNGRILVVQQKLKLHGILL